MRRLYPDSVRARLMMLVLLAVVPTLALVLANAADARAASRLAVQQDVERLAHLAAAGVAQTLEGERQLLLALARVYEVQNRDQAACNALMADLLTQYPFYAYMGVIGLDGYIICSGLPTPEPVYAGDRAYFQRVIASEGFASGDHQVGRITGQSVLVSAYPVRNDAGVLSGVVFVALSTAWLDEVIRAAPLPPGAAISIIDRKGVILARYPDPHDWVGQNQEDVAIIAMAMRDHQGTAEAPGLDGVQRLFAYVAVEANGDAGLHLLVGMPRDAAYADPDRRLFINLAGVAAGLLVGLAAAWLASTALVLRPVERLLDVTQRLKAGDLTARYGAAHGAGEIQRLSRAFDAMAESLETRSAELAQVNRARTTVSAINQAVVRAEDERSLLDRACAILVEFGGYQAAWVGLRNESSDPLVTLAASASRDGGSLPAGTLSGGKQRIARAMRLSQPVVDGGLAAAPGGFRAAMAMPLPGGGAPLGVLNLYSSQPAAFSPAEVKLLTELADDLSYGLRAVRTRQAHDQAQAHLQRNAARAQLAADISGALAEVSLNYQAVLNRLAGLLARDLAGLCLVRLISDDGQRLEMAALAHNDAAEQNLARSLLGAAPQRADDGRSGRVLRTGHAILEQRVEPNYVATIDVSEFREYFTRIGLSSMLIVPLRAQGRVLGVLGLYRGSGAPHFTLDDQSLAQGLADRAALTIANARLFASVRQLNASLEQRVAERTAQLGQLNLDLQKYAAEVEDLYNNAPCGYHLLDANGAFVRINDFELRLLGYAREEVVGRLRILDILAPESIPTFEKNFPIFLATGSVTNLEMTMLSRDGRRVPVLLSATAAYDAQGQFTASRTTLFDISDRKQAEAEIQNLYAALQQRNAQLELANKELEAFSYSVSHDLRAPLSGIDGFSLALLEDYGPQLDAQAHDYLRRVRAAAQRMADLIDALLNLSRLSRAEMRREPVDLGALARAVADDLSQREPQRQVEFVIGDGLRVRGDPRLLRVVVENLLGNAWKFSANQPATRIEFGARAPEGDEAPGGPVYFVRDNGAGFDMTYATRLFGAFQRLHSAADFPGTGIGLATVQRIVRRHGGQVWADAALGQGAVFYFTLPKA